MNRALALVAAILLANSPALAGTAVTVGDPVVVLAVAVGQNEEGRLVGATATVSITVAANGAGHLFMETRPLTQVDMQGSARLAWKVAESVTGIATSGYDVFFVVRSESEIIGGPSAGGAMAVGAVVALWNAAHPEDPIALNRSVVMTGTVNPGGSIGFVGGIPQKAQAARDAGASVFLIPQGQNNYTEVQTFREEGPGFLRESTRPVT
ncbi:MAG: S16 family serine protease, partial [Methanobacteriota archaeon]